MPSYISLFRWTDQGVRSVKETVNRTRENIAAIEKAGGKMTVLWTQGRYDLVAIGELPNEDAAMALALNTGKAGNVRTETLRAFSMDEMERILKKVM